MGNSGRLTIQQRAAMLATVTASALLFSSLTSIIVALPAVQRDLGLDSSALHWVVVAALLPLCALAVVSGRLGDAFGRRRVFLLGMACFVTGSALCAVATDGAFLVGARAVQGLGVALAVPLALANLTAALPAEKHGWAIGVQTAVVSVFAIAMPLGIALLAQYASWRWAFAATVPVAALVVVLAWRHLIETRAPATTSLDLMGCVLIACGLALLVFACERSSDWGLTDVGTLAPLTAGIALLVAFVLVERRARSPLLDLRPLRGATTSVPLAALALVQCASLALVLYMTLYLQHVLDMGAFRTGLLLLATSVGTIVLSPLVGQLTERGHGGRLVITGMAALGVCLLWLTLEVFDRRIIFLVPALLLFGLAPPLVYPSATTLVADTAVGSAKGVGAGLAIQARQVGATFGLALTNMLFTAVEWQKRNSLLKPGDAFTPEEQSALDDALTRERIDTELLAQLPGASQDHVRGAADQAFATAIEITFLTLGGIILLGALVAVTVQRGTIGRSTPRPSA
ncbi:MFS transporter [Streptomyces sp. 900105245]